MKGIEITEEEKGLLKEHLKKSPLVLIRLKCHALLMREKGMNLAAIADIVSREEKTIKRWIEDWEERHMASIFTGHKDNENAGASSMNVRSTNSITRASEMVKKERTKSR